LHSWKKAAMPGVKMTRRNPEGRVSPVWLSVFEKTGNPHGWVTLWAPGLQNSENYV
jgi:hypothetical protein